MMNVGAVRPGVIRVAAGWVVAKRGAGIRIGERGVDRRPREQPAAIVRRRRQRIAEAALIPQAL